MFYNEQYNQYVNEGQAFTLGDVFYPANWLNLSSPEEKTEAGLQEVIATNSPANQQYYWVSQELNGATLTYVNTPKDLTDVKTDAINQVNNAAYSILFPTDWMVVKAFETSTKVPTAWNTWRANVRTYATNEVSLIEATNSVDEVATIMGSLQWPLDPDQQLAAEQAQLAQAQA